MISLHHEYFYVFQIFKAHAASTTFYDDYGGHVGDEEATIIILKNWIA
jgi:hypothetical protein